MRRTWCAFSLVFFGLMVAAQLSQANAGLQVDETATRLLFHSDHAELSLVVKSSRGRPTTARIQLELIDELNRAVAQVEREVTLKPGSNTITSELPLTPSGYVLWCRLRYQVTASSGTGSGPYSTSGTISLSQICPDIFQLNLLKPVITSPGARYHFRVRAEHPVSLHPIEGVSLQAELSFDGVPSPLSSSGLTDSQGYAEFDFDLPAGLKSDGEIKVTGTRSGLSADVEDGVRIDRRIRISLSTDKDIYQPGQTLHARALVIDPSKRAVAGSELTLKIVDPEDTVVHRASLKTSRFGIASDDWAIPANIRLGDYQIKILRDESDEEDAYSPAYKVRISRYELPNFTVGIKTDQGFYIPGQNAEVEVRGDYLFGQPVTRAHVRVVRETDREWNYREQKWEISEDEKYEGELDQTGRFVAHVDLSKQQEELSERDYARFTDVSYAAYLTDLTTNRTEQRRFDVRVTKEPIHIYVIDDGYGARNDFLYVSTSYADGTPAECEVDISQDLSHEAAAVRINHLRHLRTVKTNGYGVARVAGLVIAGTEGQSGEVRPSHYNVNGTPIRVTDLDLSARDREGRLGHTSRTDQYSTSAAIRVETNKALYKPGESIEVQLTAAGRPTTLFIDVAQRWKIVHSQAISLVNGRGRLTLLYKPEFRDEVTIAAYGYGESGDLNTGNRTVLFPRSHDLRLAVNMGQPQYRPGEAATVDFRVQTGDGKATESALGVTVIDRAVEERARTDAEFGGRHDFARAFHRLWGYDEEIAGVTLSSLDELDLSKPIPPDLQLVAEILLLRRGYWLDERDTSIGTPEHEFERIACVHRRERRQRAFDRFSAQTGSQSTWSTHR
jgi:MG2 domain/Macroglobulin domain MG3/Alpha-2-macroglobulin bait region domain